jgi:hypothetical protein
MEDDSMGLSTFLKFVIVTQMSNDNNQKAEAIKCSVFLCRCRTYNMPPNGNLELNLHSVTQLKPDWLSTLSYF